VPGWPTAAPQAGPNRHWIVATVVAAMPLLLAVLLAIGFPSFMAPLTDGTVNLAGVPLIVPFTVLLVGMVFVAGLLGRYVGSGLIGVIVAAVWAGIGLWLVILGPGIVLISTGLTSAGD
jgi:hypothetical protein